MPRLYRLGFDGILIMAYRQMVSSVAFRISRTSSKVGASA